ncbi:MAG: hypothetical protein JNM93_05210 [Bacteriovoracaceae bacterium]|nr:hypothetical protein [Bacteriovoracaceae bacterium]
MNFLSLSILWAIFLTLNLAQAQTELDPQNLAPKEIVVRVDENGKVEVYKVSPSIKVDNAASAEAAIEKYVVAENKVTNLVTYNELDQVTSTESWFYFYNPNWGYNYNFGFRYNWGFNTYNFYYQPYFNYNWGNSWYYYYYWF